MSVSISYTPTPERRVVPVKRLLANHPITGAPNPHTVSEGELRALRTYIRHLLNCGELEIPHRYSIKTNGYNQLLDIVDEETGLSYYPQFHKIVTLQDETFEA